MTTSDEAWRGLEMHERVKWARERHYENMSEAARALGLESGTYRAYERAPGQKSTALNYERAQQFARRFKVRWEWLLHGDAKGEPWLATTTTSPMQRIYEALMDEDERAQERIADAVDALLGRRA